MRILFNARLMPYVFAAVCAVGVSAGAETVPPINFGLSVDGTTLTNFGSYFSLPVGLRLSGTCPIATPAPGVSILAEAHAGWWMESFRDTFRFQPELVPIMVPCAAGAALRWEPVQALSFDVGIQVGVVLEVCPGAWPSVLFLLSPGAGAQWFFADRAGVAVRFGWAWVGADPVWGGPTIQVGPVFR